MASYVIQITDSNICLSYLIFLVGIVLIFLSGATVLNEETQKDRERSKLSHLFLTVSMLGTFFTLL